MSQEIVINRSITLTCSAEGFPTPTIVWFMNDTMISNGVTGVNGSMNLFTSTLIIFDTSFDDSGVYHCQAVSSEFAYLNVTSEIANISVVGEFIIYIGLLRLLYNHSKGNLQTLII